MRSSANLVHKSHLHPVRNREPPPFCSKPDSAMDATRALNSEASSSASTETRDDLPDAYWKAKHSAEAGHTETACWQYELLLGESTDRHVSAIVLHDLAALAAVAGHVHVAEGLLRKALQLEPNNPAAQHTAHQLGLLDSCEERKSSTSHGLKIAIVSLLFNWPSKGGGNVHTVELGLGLERAGFDVRHFFLEFTPWKVGEVRSLPLLNTKISFRPGELTVQGLQDRFREAVSEYGPDHVLITDSWSLKPWIFQALDGVPRIARFDALECLCPLNNLRLQPMADRRLLSCANHRFADARKCFECVAEHSGVVGPRHSLERELSRFDTNEYHELLLEMLASASAVLVHNPLIAQELEPYAPHLRVVPIGVDPARFVAKPPPSQGDASQPVRLLFAGRTTDRIKGFQVLYEAAERLWTERQDFRIQATGKGNAAPFLEWLGWRSHHEMPRLLSECDALVAPAVVEEPFGLSVVEAMAAGRPVIGTRVGGQQFTIVDGITGILCAPGNSADLTDNVRTLLNSPERRVGMGHAARERFLAEYAWEMVIERHYRPLLEAPATISPAKGRLP